MNKIHFSLLLMMTCSFPSLAQLQSVKDVYIAGDVRIDNCDSVIIRNNQFKFPGSLIASTDTAILLDNGKFVYSASVDHPVYIGIYPVVKGRLTTSTSTYNVFLTEPGDSVMLTFYRDTIHVTGRGSEKYRAMIAVFSPSYLELATAKAKLRKSYGRHLVENMIDEDFHELTHMRDSLYQIRIDRLQHFRSAISASAFMLLQYDIYGDYQIAAMSLNALWDIKSPVARNAIISTGLPRVTSIGYVDTLNADLSVYSQHYPTSLFRRLVYRSKLRPPTYWEPVQTDSVFKEIITKFSGLMREKLIMEFLVSLKDDYNVSKIVKEAHRYITHPVLKVGLSQLNNIVIGAPFVHFELPDSSGKRFDSRKLKGKYVLIDFWFTGCLYCTVMKRSMEADVKRWMKHDNFQMVSISIDRSKEQWIKSLRTQKYSHEGSLDLYTDGKAGEHPFIKGYSINSFPTLLLVDPHGKLVTVGGSTRLEIKKILDSQLK